MKRRNRQGADFLLRPLPFCTNSRIRPEDRLTFDVQTEISQRLGYKYNDHRGTRASSAS